MADLGRSISSGLTSLKLKTPMVLFVTEDLVEFIDERRKIFQLKSSFRRQKTFHTYLHDQIQEILDSEEYKEKISDPDRIEEPCHVFCHSVSSSLG